MSIRFLGALTALALTGAAVRAENLPTLTLRELTIQADLVVLAEPVKAGELAQWKVLEVFRGQGARAGDVLVVDGMSEYTFNTDPAPAIHRAILYLHPAREARDKLHFTTSLSGVRYLTKDADVLAPEQRENPGPYVMTRREKLAWDDLVKKAKAEADAVGRVFRLKTIPGTARRNEAILDWIEQHKSEFTGSGFFEGGKDKGGWGSLEEQVFT